MYPHIQARLENNVRVLVCSENQDGTLKVKSDKRFKNTATRLMTQSICEYLAGDENTYNRGHGRPNFIGFGTMGIIQQPNLVTIDSSNQMEYLEPQFFDTNPLPEDRTRPWFESTSLALTSTQGTTTPSNSLNPHFWNPEYGWGTEEDPNNPVFQGELCTERRPGEDWIDLGYDITQRIPILRADVLSDCPLSQDYGRDGYCSSTIFYGYASVGWVNRLLSPSRKVSEIDPDTGKEIYQTESVGPQLDRIAISEFGLYEKNNIDTHGLYTLFAGFRVPSLEDIIYVSRNEVILVEWRVTVRALMPYEGVGIANPGNTYPTGIRVIASAIDDRTVQLSSVVLGPPGVRQDVTWELADPHSEGTSINQSGLLVLDRYEDEEVLYVTAASNANPEIRAKTAILTGLVNNIVTGVSITTESIDTLAVQLRATVLGKGTFLDTVTWTLEGNDPRYSTSLDNTGLLTVDPNDPTEEFKITATTEEDTRIKSIAAVVRIDATAGEYIVSDFSILTSNE